MTISIAFECFADQDVCIHLRDSRGLRLKLMHEGGQGDVVNQVLVAKKASIGMVDEDPDSSHHRLRDQTELESDLRGGVQVRQKDGRFLIIVRPELEECFIASAQRAGFKSSLPANPGELRRLLGIPGHPAHATFRSELGSLHQIATANRIPTLVTDLEDSLKRLFAGSI